MYNRLLFLSLCLLSLMLVAGTGCDSGGDAEEIGKSIEDRLSEALEFDGGERIDGSPPEGLSDASAPQIDGVMMSRTLYTGSGVASELQSDYGQAEKVVGAIVYVEGAESYWKISKEMIQQVVLLTGRLKEDAEILGKDFTLKFALQASIIGAARLRDDPTARMKANDLLTGAYVPVAVTVSEEKLPDTDEQLSGMTVDGAEVINESPPTGSSGAQAPQISSIEAPREIAPTQSVKVLLRSDFTETVTAAILAVPDGESHMEITGTLENGTLIVTGSFVGRNLQAGDVLTFLWALKSEGGKVGQYRTWIVTVVKEALSDGDQGLDGDVEEDILDGDEESMADGDEQVDGDIPTDGDQVDGDLDLDISPDIYYDPTTDLLWENLPSLSKGTYADAQYYCENLQLAEYVDWRLPSISELRSLIRGCSDTVTGGPCNVADNGCLGGLCRDSTCDGCMINTGPADGCYWPSRISSSCTFSWSSSRYADAGGNAWVVYFSSGYMTWKPMTDIIAIRCVRGEPPFPVDGDMDVDMDEEEDIITEMEVEQQFYEHCTNLPALQWQNPTAPSVMNLANAESYCLALDHQGHADWRMPSICELRSLIRGCTVSEVGGACKITDDCLGLACDVDCNGCTNNGGPDAGCYWEASMDGNCGGTYSSSLREGTSTQAWRVFFPSGSLDYVGTTTGNAVRCVRDAVDEPDGDLDPDLDPDPDPEPEIEISHLWQDPDTGLIWNNSIYDGPTLLLTESFDYCNTFTLEGLTDWRLPNISELRSLIYGCPDTVTGGSCGVEWDCNDSTDPLCYTVGCYGCTSGAGPELCETAIGVVLESSLVVYSERGRYQLPVDGHLPGRPNQKYEPHLFRCNEQGALCT